ncbi:hypothetical protein Lbru_2142 [Legionella brunensis]|uniref:Uncharacterized protein n=1 Tax=Legionella brunensis TaxID=29422 RepID=A0A0W0SDY6_9GAMM|nr:hypothetical protein Lbru_2142 [Legionella brunensis]
MLFPAGLHQLESTRLDFKHEKSRVVTQNSGDASKFAKLKQMRFNVGNLFVRNNKPCVRQS